MRADTATGHLAAHAVEPLDANGVALLGEGQGHPRDAFHEFEVVRRDDRPIAAALGKRDDGLSPFRIEVVGHAARRDPHQALGGTGDLRGRGAFAGVAHELRRRDARLLDLGVDQ